MLGRGTTGRSAALVLMALAGVVGGLSGTAVAQERQIMVMSSGGLMGGSDPRQVAQSSVDRYASVVGMTAEQKEAAKLLWEGYSAAFREASTTRRDKTQAVMQTFQETQDHSVMREKMPEIRKEFTDRATKLEKEFFGDLKALLSTDQETAWPKVERLRRREVGLTRSFLSGDSLDLTEIVGNLKLPANAGLSEAMEQYEADLDRALQAREADLKGLEEATANLEAGPDAFAKMQEEQAKAREASSKIRDVHASFARRLEGLMPEDVRGKFRDQIKHKTYPTVYRQSHVSRSIEAASKFDDVSGDVKAQLTELAAKYARESAPLNDEWANQIKAQDDSGEGDLRIGDMAMRMSNRQEGETSPLDTARKARRELDDRYKQQLEALLTPEQKARLPKPERNQIEGVPGGMFITESTVSIGRPGGG